MSSDHPRELGKTFLLGGGAIRVLFGQTSALISFVLLSKEVGG